MADHAHTDDGYLGNIVIDFHFLGTDFFGRGLHDFLRCLHILFRHREGQIREALRAGVLDDHIDADMPL